MSNTSKQDSVKLSDPLADPNPVIDAELSKLAADIAAVRPAVELHNASMAATKALNTVLNVGHTFARRCEPEALRDLPEAFTPGLVAKVVGWLATWESAPDRAAMKAGVLAWRDVAGPALGITPAQTAQCDQLLADLASMDDRTPADLAHGLAKSSATSSVPQLPNFGDSARIVLVDLTGKYLPNGSTSGKGSDWSGIKSRGSKAAGDKGFGAKLTDSLAAAIGRGETFAYVDAPDGSHEWQVMVTGWSPEPGPTV